MSDSQLECGGNPQEEVEGRRLVLQEGLRGGAKAHSCWRAKGYLGGLGHPMRLFVIEYEATLASDGSIFANCDEICWIVFQTLVFELCQV